jgi:hypothetical protein
VTRYVRFASEGGGTAEILVEVDSAGPAAREQNAGLGQRVRDQAGTAASRAQSGFEQAVQHAVGVNARAFLAAADALLRPPAEMEITFSLTATGEAGNLAVGKIGGEANYQVRMLWKRPDEVPAGERRDGVL